MSVKGLFELFSRWDGLVLGGFGSLQVVSTCLGWFQVVPLF